MYFLNESLILQCTAHMFTNSATRHSNRPHLSPLKQTTLASTQTDHTCLHSNRPHLSPLRPHLSPLKQTTPVSTQTDHTCLHSNRPHLSPLKTSYTLQLTTIFPSHEILHNIVLATAVLKNLTI